MFALFLYIDGLKGRFEVLIHQAIGTEELQKGFTKLKVYSGLIHKI